MLPTPETRLWSSSARLIAESRRRSPAAERLGVEVRVQRVAGDVRELGRDALVGPVLSRDELVEQHPAEGALVDEAQLGPVVGEADPHVQVLLVRRPGGLDQQLAAHAEVADQALVAVGERQPQVLAAPRDRGERRAGQARGEVLRAGEVAADGPRRG